MDMKTFLLSTFYKSEEIKKSQYNLSRHAYTYCIAVFFFVKICLPAKLMD